MMIQSFEIQKFKGLDSICLENCGYINAIVGKNNSGKSSVLHAIDMAGLALSVNGWDRFQPKLEVKDLFADVGQFSLSLTFEDWSKIGVKATPDYGPSFTPQPTDKQRIKTVLILPDVGSSMVRRQHRTPQNIISQVENRNFADVNALDVLYAIRFYADRSQRGFTPASYASIIDEIKRYFPDIDDVQSARTEHDVATLTYCEYGREIDILYSGTGLKHFLDVLLKTTVSGANVVLLDEPEMGLHPDLQRRFVEYVSRLAREKNIQFFLATHSQVLLNYADSIVYYRINNTKGARNLTRVDRNAIETLLSDLGLKPSDVLNQDICVLVEGATDVVFFEHIIRILYKDEFERIAVAVIQYAGSAAEGIISGAIDVSNIVPAQRFTFWIRDRDAAPNEMPSTNSTKFVNALKRKDIPAHITKKREIEYYLPENILIAAQQGDEHKIQTVQGILNGDQREKFKTAARKEGVCVPFGNNLRNLLAAHLTSRDQLDQEFKDIITNVLIPWRDLILGKGN
jgi:predicted ATPase